MSDLDDRRNAIATALRSLPALASITVRFCVHPADAFSLNLSKQSEIFLSYGGAKNLGVGVMNTNKQLGRETWFISSVSTSFKNATDAQAKTGGAFDLVEAVRDVQRISLTSPRETYLKWISETLAEAPDRSVNGGSLGFISEFEAPQRLY